MSTFFAGLTVIFPKVSITWKQRIGKTVQKQRPLQPIFQRKVERAFSVCQNFEFKDFPNRESLF